MSSAVKLGPFRAAVQTLSDVAVTWTSLPRNMMYLVPSTGGTKAGLLYRSMVKGTGWLRVREPSAAAGGGGAGGATRPDAMYTWLMSAVVTVLGSAARHVKVMT
jgi:hypothetical protein